MFKRKKNSLTSLGLSRTIIFKLENRINMFRKTMKHKTTRTSKTVLSYFGWMSQAHANKSRVGGISGTSVITNWNL